MSEKDKCEHVFNYEETYCTVCMKPMWEIANDNGVDELAKLGEKITATEHNYGIRIENLKIKVDEINNNLNENRSGILKRLDQLEKALVEDQTFFNRETNERIEKLEKKPCMKITKVFTDKEITDILDVRLRVDHHIRRYNKEIKSLKEQLSNIVDPNGLALRFTKGNRDDIDNTIRVMAELEATINIIKEKMIKPNSDSIEELEKKLLRFEALYTDIDHKRLEKLENDVDHKYNDLFELFNNRTKELSELRNQIFNDEGLGIIGLLEGYFNKEIESLKESLEATDIRADMHENSIYGLEEIKSLKVVRKQIDGKHGVKIIRLETEIKELKKNKIEVKIFNEVIEIIDKKIKELKEQVDMLQHIAIDGLDNQISKVRMGIQKNHGDILDNKEVLQELINKLYEKELYPRSYHKEFNDLKNKLGGKR